MSSETYRRLEKGEIIREGDEVDACNNSWHDDPKWVPVSSRSIGQPASDPKFISHSQFRRRVEAAK